MKIVLVGARNGSHIGGSFERAALAAGHDVLFCDATAAFDAPALWRHFHWRLRRRPPRLAQFSEQVEHQARAFGAELLIATGLAPLEARSIRRLRAAGIECINYLTDDPWNPGFRAGWLFESMATYDSVFSPRRANLDDLRALGVAQVSYLPFAYDHEIFFPGAPRELRFDVVFAGGADPDRFPWFRALLERGYQLGLFGSGWARYPDFRPFARGLIEPAELKHVVAASKLALCIVRHANRDGHAMRTFELPAMRSCLIAEDTTEQRHLLGDTVAWFANTPQLIQQIDALLADPGQRDRFAAAAHARIVGGGNTYADRLETMLSAHPAATRA